MCKYVFDLLHLNPSLNEHSGGAAEKHRVPNTLARLKTPLEPKRGFSLSFQLVTAALKLNYRSTDQSLTVLFVCFFS